MFKLYRSFISSFVSEAQKPSQFRLFEKARPDYHTSLDKETVSSRAAGIKKDSPQLPVAEDACFLQHAWCR